MLLFRPAGPVRGARVSVVEGPGRHRRRSPSSWRCCRVALDSGVWLTFVMMALYAALLAQAWNILGGYGGQFSFGHALFFGTGAYAQALLQIAFGLNAWLALAAGGRARRAAVGAAGRRAALPLRAEGLLLRARHARLRRGRSASSRCRSASPAAASA